MSTLDVRSHLEWTLIFLVEEAALVVYHPSMSSCYLRPTAEDPSFSLYQPRDASGEDFRRGRMSLHAELPASKAKREQALRNILAAKRRQILGHRLSQHLRNLEKPRPSGIPKEIGDVLEFQESRHGIYITAPVGVEADIAVGGGAPQPLTRAFIKTASVGKSSSEDVRNSTNNGPGLIKQIAELRSLAADNGGSWRNRSENGYKSSLGGIPRAGYFFAHRNNSSTHRDLKPPAKTTSVNEPETRRANNTVLMSDSLYKHFRPVESNVPAEDVTQFLYFGQKLSPETQNTTSSNSLEATPTQTPLPIPRRRFHMKRFSTTTSVPVPKLEEIINEEMNIAVEKGTVERNKMTKIKNVFRSPGVGSLYYRKSSSARPSDSTIATNVIGSSDTKNPTESDSVPKSETGPRRNDEESVSVNPSAHASVDRVEMLDRRLENIPSLSSFSSHDGNGSRNAAELTQISSEGEEGNSTEKLVSREEMDVKETRGVEMGGNKSNARVTSSVSRENDRKDRNEERSSSGYDTLGIIVSNGPTTTDLPAIGLSSGPLDAPVERNVERPVKSTSSIGGAPPVALLGQQQHVYAYTITNVTRLLRNYSGPGVSSQEEGEQQDLGSVGTGKTVEINGGPPSGIVATRSRSDLSAGSAAEGVTTLVGDRANYEAGDYVPASKPDAASRGATRSRAQLEVNKSAEIIGEESLSLSSLEIVNKSVEEIGNKSDPVIGKKSAIEGREIDRESRIDIGDVDQRMLQKSASAVLNQRPNDEESIVDGDLGKGVTVRRHQSRGYQSRSGERLSKEARRTTTPSSATDDSVSNEPGPKLEPNKSIGPRSRPWISSDESASIREEIETRIENEATESRGIIDGNTRLERVDDRVQPGVLAEEPIGRTSEVTDRYDPSVSVPLRSAMSPREDPSSSSSNVEKDEESNESRNLGVSRTLVGNVDSKPKPEAIGNGTGRENVPHSPEREVRIDSMRKEPGTTVKPLPESSTTLSDSMTTIGPLDGESNSVTVVIESTTDYPVNRAMVNASDANRPFGIAKDLSPSEIQKMYRSSNNGKSETTTTVIPEATTLPRSVDDSGSSLTPLNSTTTRENWNGERTVNVERSPEVRGRNLSDKSSDKDDILPIMHLYNTSSIFNASTSIEANSASTLGQNPKPTVLPVGIGNHDEEENDAGPVTVPSVAPETPPSAIDLGNDRGTRPGTLPDPTSNATRRKDPENSSSVRGTNGTNRTRFKPTNSINSPNLTNTEYDAPMNRTFFESRLLSSREPVNVSDVISTRHEGDTIATHETVTVVSYILVTLVVFPIAVGVGLILRRLIIRNRKMLEESDTSSEISCRKKALNLENGDFKTSIEKAITKLPRIQHLCHEVDKPPPSPPVQESRWEFPRDKLRLQTVLGQGNFGQVWKAEADNLTGHQGTTRLVAVKTVKEGASSREKEDLVRELEIMQQLGNHPNVVTLLGCCTEEEPHYLILEYVMYGKLLAYLRDHRTRQDFYNFSEDSAALTSRDLTVFGYCVARGMEYLASKKIIHRDLAARNVLVDHNKLCKIADFGMSRFANDDGEVIETRHGRNALPIRWMAPESLIYSLFTTKTDVWSFGILMWEIVTLGSTPYPDMTAREVMRNVQSGYRLERPSHCRSELFRVISRCWQADPDRRPEFQVLRRDLAQLLEDNMNGHYVDLESFASECTD